MSIECAVVGTESVFSGCFAGKLVSIGILEFPGHGTVAFVDE